MPPFNSQTTLNQWSPRTGITSGSSARRRKSLEPGAGQKEPVSQEKLSQSSEDVLDHLAGWSRDYDWSVMGRSTA